MAMRTAFLASALFLLATGWSWADYTPVNAKVPEPRREFRAAWIATVHNLDWPSTYTLSPQQQRSEMVALPCVVMGGTALESVEAVAATRADFVALSSAVFTGTLPPGDAVAAANRLLDEKAPALDDA